MLKIRKQQIEEFERADAPHVPARLVQHARQAFPKHCTYLGDPGVGEAAQYALQQAGKHGFRQVPGVQLFLDLMFLLGRHFDTDPMLPWAVQVLADTSYPDEAARTKALHAKAMDYLNTVSGPNNEFIDQAQVRIGQERPEGSPTAADFEKDMLDRMQRIFPQKYAYTGEDVLRQVIQRGVLLARQYDLKQVRAVVVLIGLMYMLGTGFDTDPQFQAITGVLQDKSEPDPAKRADQLHQAAMKYLKEWCG